MKKTLFGALLLAAATVFVGCKPNEDPSAVTGISVTPTEVTLSEGGSIRLTATLTPEGATGDITWETSDTTVVTVSSNGYVEAQGIGTANVTASCGDYKAVCAVSVKSYLETLSFTGAILWDEDTTYAQGKVDTIETSNGSTYYAYKALGTLYVMSDGFYFNNSGNLDGTTQGSVIKVYAPFYYATAALNHSDRGTVFTLGEWVVSSEYEEGTAHVGTPGAIDEAKYLGYMKAFVEGYNNATTDDEASAAYENLANAGDSCFTGAVMESYSYHSTTEGYSEDGYYGSYTPDGIILSGDFSLNAEFSASEYMCGIDYSFFTLKAIDSYNNYWGCNWSIDQSTGVISWVDQTLHYLDNIEYSYGTKETSETKKYQALNIPVMTQDYPEIAKRMQKQLDQKCKLTIKK